MTRTAPPAMPGRHTLVWPNMIGMRALRAGGAPAAMRARVLGWVEAGRPLVVRRRNLADPFGHCPVALSLAGSARPARRCACSLPPAGIDRYAPPPTLAELHAAGSLPDAWDGTVRVVLALACAFGPRPRVFGSALWAHLAGDHAAFHPHSDLDLLWCRNEFHTTADIDRLLAGLAAVEDNTPRLDGELVWPDGTGVQWRELAGSGPDDAVLAKHPETVRLWSRRELEGATAAWSV